MPYIAINTAQELSYAQKDKIKTELGRLISIIPTKTEAGLLIDFSGGRTMFRAGADVPGAFVEIRLYTKAELEPKKEFTKEFFNLLTTELGIKQEHIYLNILEFDNWGSNGVLR